MFDLLKDFCRRMCRIDDFILLRVDGGLGSVLLVYALALTITMKTGKKIKYDASWFNDNAMDCDNKFTRKFTIKKLFPSIGFELASDKEIAFYKKFYKYKNKKTWLYNPILFSNTKPTYYTGYYSHYKYWIEAEEILQRNLDFSSWKLDEKNSAMKLKIENSTYSVGIHVRRGDFVNLGWCCLNSLYYIKAIQHIQAQVNQPIQLFFFSNDCEYVKQELLPHLNGGGYRFTIVDINDNDTGYYDMYLMSLCNSIIIADSIFSISSAILNKHKDKIIVAPESWCYNIGKDNKKGKYDGIEESFLNPNWVHLHHQSGELVQDCLGRK